MFRYNPSRFIEPEEAISALYQAFRDEYTIDRERLLTLIEEAYSPKLKKSRNHLIRAIQVFRVLGYAREDLIDALYMKPERLLPANPYADQKVESARGYRTDVDRLHGFEKLQNLRTRLDLPGFGDNHLTYLSDGGVFEDSAVVMPDALALQHGINDPYGAGYHRLLGVLAEKLREVVGWSGLDFWSSGLEVFPFQRLELHPVAREAFRELDRRSYDGYACYPAQFGLRWRGSSMERAAWHLEHGYTKVGPFQREFPLPAYAVLCELIADPHRLVGERILAIDCPGDVVTDTRGRYFRGGLSFVFQNKRLHLIVRPRESADEECGSASGLVPLT